MSRAFTEERIVEEDEVVEPEESTDDIKKVFINHVNSYQGKHIARLFATAISDPTMMTTAAATTTNESNEEEKTTTKKHIRFDDQHLLGEGWKVFGTIQNIKNYNQPSFIEHIYDSHDREEFFDHLVRMNVIIYDITQDPNQIDEAVWICQRLESSIKQLGHRIIFILLSPVMTWAKTQPSEEDVPFTDDDYRRRRAHIKYKDHHTAEKIITKLGLTNKDKLFTYVVVTGLTYGFEEDVFHYLFKAAWYNTPELPVYGAGTNFLPTIHVLDLAIVLQNLAEHQYKIRYIVATDTGKYTLLLITRRISQILGSGRITFAEHENAMFNNDITQVHFEMLSVNLQFLPMFIKENIKLKWHCENGLIENLPDIVEEFRFERNLTPIKICIFGPPASGKTTIARQLAEEYKIHHLQTKDVLDETKRDLEQLVKSSNDREYTNDDFQENQPEEISSERIEEARNLLEKLDDHRRDSKNVRYDDETLTQVFKLKLMSSSCQNQGYILDGYPKTFDQAQNLFGSIIDDGEENSEEKRIVINERIFPDYIFVLEADNSFLRQRILYLPEKLAIRTHNTELEFKRRLKFYNDLGDDYHPAKYFEDLDRFYETFKIDEDQSLNHRSIVEKIMERIKKPHNYGLSDEDEEYFKRKQLIEIEKHEREEREEREREEFELANEHKRKQQEWMNKLEQIHDEQDHALNTQTLPLRNYLMKHVMPTLTKALIECCQIQPEDPVDFVAEYLFKNNPQM